MTKTLKELLTRELEEQDETPEDIRYIRVSAGVGYGSQGSFEASFGDLEQFEGDTGFGGESLPRLYAWTVDRVYFKNVYDGAESVQSVPRNPSEEEPERHG